MLQPAIRPLGAFAAYPLAFGLCAGGAVAACVLALRAPPLGRRAWATLAVAMTGYGLAAGVLGDSGPGHLVGSTSLLVLAFLAGRAIADRVERPGHLLPAALVAAAADSWSVLAPTGVTHAVLERPELLPLLVLTFPALGGQGYAPLLGGADICVVTLFLRVCARFELAFGRALIAVAVALFLTVALVMALAQPIPALPVLVGALVVALWPSLRVTRQEWGIAMGFAAALAAAAGALAWLR